MDELTKSQIEKTLEEISVPYFRAKDLIGYGSSTDDDYYLKIINLVDKYLERNEVVEVKNNWELLINKNKEQFEKAIRDRHQKENKRKIISYVKKLASRKFINKVFPGFLDIIKEKENALEENQNEDFYPPYIMEKDVRNKLATLKKFQEKNNTQVIDTSFLDVTPSGNIINHQEGAPGIIDDYRSKNWGIDRICLDGFQNHLPHDSKGENSFLQFLVGDKWMNCEEAKLHKDEITKVKFADDGVGFDYTNLYYLHSNKSDDSKSAGQFGEGLKLISMAAVNLGLGMEIQSRNWIAHVEGEDVNLINNLSDNKEETHKKLVYKVDVYDGEPIKGSRTIFNTPSKEFIDYALKLPEYILPLSKKDYEFIGDKCSIVSTDVPGRLFVKGIYVKDTNSLFSYNFDEAELTPDRNDFNHFNPKSNISELIRYDLDDPEIIKCIVANLIEVWKNSNDAYKADYWKLKSDDKRKAAEIELQYVSSKMEGERGARIWKEAFEEVSGIALAEKQGEEKPKIAIKTDYKIPEYLEKNIQQYNLINLPKDWANYFIRIGIPSDKDILPEYIEDKVYTSIPLEYGEGLWESKKIVIDASQNHLPSDSKGSNIFLRFQTEDEKWHDYRDMEKYSDSEIKKIKLLDDGIGYDYKSLGVFASVKNHEKSGGKWGEGIKMLCAAALRSGTKVELRSRDWLAIPDCEEVTLNSGKINEKKVQQLFFKIKKAIPGKESLLSDNDIPETLEYGYSKGIEKSSTTFIDPSPELIKEFRNIRENVLAFNNITPLASIGNNHLLSTDSNNLYIKSLLVPGEHSFKYSYNFEDFDIETRDRNVITRDSSREQIRKILEGITDEKLISRIISDAVIYCDGEQKDFLEFETNFEIESGTPQADAWINAYMKLFGEKTALRSVKSQNFNAVHQAEHLGLKTITLPDNIAKAISGVKDSKGRYIPSIRGTTNEAIKNARPISNELLKSKEKEIIKRLYKYNVFFEIAASNPEEFKPISEIRVYDYDDNYLGPRAAGFAGRGVEDVNVINISRETLKQGLRESGDVFFHEAGHVYTGAEDADTAFRDFQTRLLSAVAEKTVLGESIENGELEKNVTIGNMRRILNCIGKRKNLGSLLDNQDLNGKGDGR